LPKGGAGNTLLVTGGLTRDCISEARMATIASVLPGAPAGNVQAAARARSEGQPVACKRHSPRAHLSVTIPTSNARLASVVSC
jgi:hypothetical protein